jgi:histidinol-phosphate aminotransferase
MNRMATAGALAALADQQYLNEVLERISRSRDRITAIARDNGLSPLPSATNFVAIDCGRDQAFAREIVDRLMAEHGVFIRMPGVAPLNRCIRVSTGPEADMAVLEDALPKVLEAMGNGQ